MAPLGDSGKMFKHTKQSSDAGARMESLPAAKKHVANLFWFCEETFVHVTEAKCLQRLVFQFWNYFGEHFKGATKIKYEFRSWKRLVLANNNDIYFFISIEQIMEM